VLRREDDLGYLLRALRNNFISGRRATARRPRNAGADAEALDLPDPRTGAAEPPAAAEARAAFAAIAPLRGEFRKALVAIDVAGLSYAEAVSALRTRKGTIASRLFRARSQVANAFPTLERIKKPAPARRPGGSGPLDRRPVDEADDITVERDRAPVAQSESVVGLGTRACNHGCSDTRARSSPRSVRDPSHRQ
jgi:hypothetical protein